VTKITEAQFQAQVLHLAKMFGWRTAHFRPAKTSQGWRTAVQGDGIGFPDLILVRKEMIVAELKRDRTCKTTPNQDAWLEAFRFVPGVLVYLWTPEDWDEIERVLR